jgi:hypothetical protein
MPRGKFVKTILMMFANNTTDKNAIFAIILKRAYLVFISPNMNEMAISWENKNLFE